MSSIYDVFLLHLSSSFFHLLSIGDISLDFCGRRIHVNKSFRLILTLSSLPPHQSTSQIFSCRFNFINASTSSLPLAQELTLQEAQKDANSDAYSLDSYNTLMSAIAESDEKRRELSERLLKCLGRVTDGIVNCYIVSEVEDVIKSYKEVHTYHQHIPAHIYVHVLQ